MARKRADGGGVAGIQCEYVSTQVRGEVTYNGYGFDECVVGRTAAYVDQNDNHIAELTVRETLVRMHDLILPTQSCLLHPFLVAQRLPAVSVAEAWGLVMMVT